MDPLLDPPQVHSAIPVSAHLKRSSTLVRYFFVIAGVLSLFFVLIGFSDTYIIPMASGKYSGRALLHIHGGAYFLWVLFAISQPLLVRLKNIHLHRKMGTAAFMLAAIMFILGITVSISAANLQIANGDPVAAKAFLLIPLSDMLLFATFISLSILNLKNPETHKRLMILATLSVLPAAFGRMFPMVGILELTPLNILFALILQESILILGITADLVSKRRVHPVYIWGGIALVVVHVFRMPLGNTTAWLRVADFILGIN